MRKKMALEMATQAMEQTRALGYGCLSNPSPAGCPATSPSGIWESVSTVTYSFLTQSFSAQQRRRVTDETSSVANKNKKVEIEVCWPTCGVTTSTTIGLATYIAP